MTRDEVKPILATIEATYPGYFKNEAGDAARQRLNVWAVALANEPAQEVNAALIEAMKVCTFPPSIADIFKQLRARRAGALPGVEEMWHIACAAVKEFRTNKERANSGGYIDAAGRKHTRADLLADNQTRFDALPGPIKKWGGGPNEMISMFDREDGDLMTYVYPSFKKAVEAALAQEVRQLEQLPPEERPCLDALPPAGE